MTVLEYMNRFEGEEKEKKNEQKVIKKISFYKK